MLLLPGSGISVDLLQPVQAFQEGPAANLIAQAEQHVVHRTHRCLQDLLLQLFKLLRLHRQVLQLLCQTRLHIRSGLLFDALNPRYRCHVPHTS